MAWPEKLPSGRFRGVYRDANGDQHTVVDEDGRGFRLKRDAKAAADEEEVKARRRASRKSPSAKLTWGEWWNRIAPDRVRPETNGHKNEASMVKNHIMPEWGDVPLNQIDRVQVQNWVNDGLRPREGMKPNSARRIYGIFSMSINMAVRRGVLDASPCAGIVLPTVPKRSKPTLHVGDSDDLSRQDYKDAVDFMLETGLRPGELCGLHANMINRPRPGWLHVKHVYVQDAKLIRPWPKDKDERYVPLTPKALEILARRLEGRDLKGGCGVKHFEDARCRSVLVFWTERGLPMTPIGLRSYLNRHGLTGPYGARRGQITRALDGGGTPTDVAFMAGHSSLDQTADYWQVSDALRDRIIAAMGQHEGLTVVEQEDTRGADRGADLWNTATHDETKEPDETTG